MRIVCWQTIHMKYHSLFFRKLRKMLPAAVVIDALRVKVQGMHPLGWCIGKFWVFYDLNVKKVL